MTDHLRGNWWQCSEHGLTQDPIWVGSFTYCPADDCVLRIESVHTTAQDLREQPRESAWTRQRTVSTKRTAERRATRPPAAPAAKPQPQDQTATKEENVTTSAPPATPALPEDVQRCIAALEVRSNQANTRAVRMRTALEVLEEVDPSSASVPLIREAISAETATARSSAEAIETVRQAFGVDVPARAPGAAPEAAPTAARAAAGDADDKLPRGAVTRAVLAAIRGGAHAPVDIAQVAGEALGTSSRPNWRKQVSACLAGLLSSGRVTRPETGVYHAAA